MFAPAAVAGAAVVVAWVEVAAAAVVAAGAWAAGDAERRVRFKSQEPLADLLALRKKP